MFRGGAKRNLDAKTPRCEDAKSVTEINFVNSGDEHESIVGWGCYPNNENHDNSRNSRHSERIAKESSLLQYKAVAKNENNSTETDQASMPLGIFASKLVSTSKNLAAWLPSPLAAKKAAFTLVEGATHVAHCDKFRRVAFTLAEVLITLGIIGVVAALTLPSVIHKYRAEVLRTRFLQANTIVQDGVTQMRAADIDLNEVINNRDLPTIRKYIKGGDCRLPKNLEEANYWNYFENLPARQASATVLEQPYCMASGMTLWFVRLYEWKDSAQSGMKKTKYSLLAVDINGWEQKPNVYGKDMFFWFYNGENGALGPTGENMNVSLNSAYYYIDCPGRGSAEAGAGCTSKALSEADYFKKLKL